VAYANELVSGAMMKFGRAWNVEGVRPRVRETAQAAARRSGMSVGEWLDTTIIQQAADEGIYLSQPAENGDSSRDIDHELASINDRLDALVSHVSRLQRTNPDQSEQLQRSKPANADISQQLVDKITQLDQRVEQAVNEGRIAANEIEHRVTSVSQTLTNLGREQPESVAALAYCDDLIQTLRQDLNSINHVLADAMPRRAIEAIENEIRSLAKRMETSRQSEADNAKLAGLERGLAEVREALRALTPAESLVEIDQAVQALSRKIDTIAATNQDPHSLRQIDAAIAGLHTVVSRVASSEALATLASEVRTLAEKLENGFPAHDEILSNLDRRIAAIADALEASRRENSRAIPAGFDAMMKSLAEKFERKQADQGPAPGLGPLEERITALLQKLDASEARLDQLGAIKQGMSDLLAQLEHMRANGSASFAAVNAAVEALKQTVGELKQSQTAAERQTQDSLEAVHSTIENVVDRLAGI
jgi:localization factor PodJL